MTDINRVGLVAGQHNLPIYVAQGAMKQNIEVFAFAIKGLTSESLVDHVEKVFWIGLGEFGRLISLLHENNIQFVTMAGKIPSSMMFTYDGFDTRSQQLLDNADSRLAAPMLENIARELAQENITILDSTRFIPELLIPKGLITESRPLTQREKEDILFGYPVARQIAAIDIGQTIVVKDGVVVAVEAAEGTSAAISRASGLCGEGFVVIKVSKPDQDFRFDVPTIGLKTIDVIASAGGCVLAVTAQETLFVDRECAVKRALEANIAIVGIQDIDEFA